MAGKGPLYNIILYYNFQPIRDTDAFCRKHKQICLELGLLGRIYIAHEGINGTLGGPEEGIAAYKKFLRSVPGYGNTEFKEDASDYLPFRKLVVKVRPEIVTLKADESVDLTKERGRRIKPDEWRKILESDEDYVLIDTRNRYEWAIGHFEGALLPDVDNFYDFPEWIKQMDIDRNKKVLIYCTGGIRCEKFSVLMEKKGYRNVFQLHGGIINYGKKEGGAHFRGRCFVFDDRLSVPVNKGDDTPISLCKITGEPCDTYINCANPDCNKLFLCTEKGAKMMEGCCSEACMRSDRKRPLDENNVFAPTGKWYEYFDQKI